MFRISKATLAIPPLTVTGEVCDNDSAIMSQLCVSESWSGDLLSGIITLGPRSSQLHGLPECECGLLGLLRCYNQLDHDNILRIFEQASTNPSRFCFSTSISVEGAPSQPVFCMGESNGPDDPQNGVITGAFIFPRISA